MALVSESDVFAVAIARRENNALAEPPIEIGKVVAVGDDDADGGADLGADARGVIPCRLHGFLGADDAADIFAAFVSEELADGKFAEILKVGHRSPSSLDR